MAVFLFDGTDVLVDVFASTEEAERWMEPVDVADGEYSIAYLVDGTCLTPTTDGDRVVLTPTGKVNDTALRDGLRDAQRRAPNAPAASDPAAFASAWLAPRPSRWRRHRDQAPLSSFEIKRYPSLVKWFARDGTEGLTHARVEFVQDDYAARVRRAPGKDPDLE